MLKAYSQACHNNASNKNTYPQQLMHDDGNISRRTVVATNTNAVTITVVM